MHPRAPEADDYAQVGAGPVRMLREHATQCMCRQSKQRVYRCSYLSARVVMWKHRHPLSTLAPQSAQVGLAAMMAAALGLENE